MHKAANQEVNILGVGAWGPGFNTWQELCEAFGTEVPVADNRQSVAPKPAIIPANERRRAPLLVRIAVEVSSQALQQAGLAAEEVACVFGSGLGDTEITDYMCRQLTTPEKALSPTKFHNSVHNAAAGYWTISTDCMKAANSIAAFDNTAGLALLEGVSHAVTHQEPVLVTLFDIPAHGLFADLFACDHGFAAAVLIAPSGAEPQRVVASSQPQRVVASSKPQRALARAQISLTGEQSFTKCHEHGLNEQLRGNPAAAVLPLLESLHKLQTSGETRPIVLATSAKSALEVQLETPL